MSKGFWECLKWELDIRIKPKLSGIKMGFMCTPALNGSSLKNMVMSGRTTGGVALTD